MSYYNNPYRGDSINTHDIISKSVAYQYGCWVGFIIGFEKAHSENWPQYSYTQEYLLKSTGYKNYFARKLSLIGGWVTFQKYYRSSGYQGFICDYELEQMGDRRRKAVRERDFEYITPWEEGHVRGYKDGYEVYWKEAQEKLEQEARDKARLKWEYYEKERNHQNAIDEKRDIINDHPFGY